MFIHTVLHKAPSTKCTLRKHQYISRYSSFFSMWNGRTNYLDLFQVFNFVEQYPLIVSQQTLPFSATIKYSNNVTLFWVDLHSVMNNGRHTIKCFHLATIFRSLHLNETVLITTLWSIGRLIIELAQLKSIICECEFPTGNWPLTSQYEKILSLQFSHGSQSNLNFARFLEIPASAADVIGQVYILS